MTDTHALHEETRDIRIGFVGLGNQGAPMALRIADAGFPLTVWARRPRTLETFRRSDVNVVENLAELGAACDQVGICVVNDADVEDVLIGQGLLRSMSSGAIVAIHSTVHPDTCRRLAALASDRGIHVLDAPVSGGNDAAREGRLTVMVGGNSLAFDQALPMFRTYARLVRLLGPIGSGQIGKIVNNLLFFVNCVTSNATLDLGSAIGLDEPAFREVLLASSGGSFALQVRDVIFDGGQIRGDTHVTKDVNLAIDLARQLGGDLGVLDQVARVALEIATPISDRG
jgi:3-hydroxyisobutyrate dehydrogenase-like beta-hydroxyacid dehydrogenase